MDRTALAPPVQLFDAAEVRRALGLLLPAGQVTELRILDAATNTDRWPHTASGYFDDAEKLLAALDSVRAARAFYFVPNAVNPALLARAANRIRKADKGGTTGDGDIQSRRWLLVDCDPQRPTGISATDAEHEAALERARVIWNALHFNHGWPEPIAADSGNGAHLLYRVDLAVDDGGLVQRCLTALAAQFDDDGVKVDTGVFNPARIWKLYGTLACKGDSTADRPHRMSRILSAPDPPIVVSREQLEELASEAPQAALQQVNGSGHSNGSTFDIESFLQRHGFEVDDPAPYQGGRKWTFHKSPLCEHHGDGPYLIQFANGALSAGCHHNSCVWTWRDLRAKYEPKLDNGLYERLLAKASSNGSSEVVTPALVKKKLAVPLSKFTFAELRTAYPHLNPPIIDGLIREGETCNIIANSKAGKSWLAYYILLCTVTGRPIFHRFATSAGRCLLIDNELHKPTLANRIPAVASAMQIHPNGYENNLDVWTLRGNLRTMADLADELQQLESATYRAILFDAKYRFASSGTSENDNAAETQLYNLLDQVAEHTQAALLLIHHGSKGSQTDKRVTDVGAGAGAQSRAADCHLILREHEEPGVVVLEAAVRSFAPVEPLALRWQFPLWVPIAGVDTAKLKGRQTAKQQQQTQEDHADCEKILAAVPAIEAIAASATAIGRRTGISRDRLKRLLNWLESQKKINATEGKVSGNKCLVYSINETTE